jgi:hypothetical protein
MIIDSNHIDTFNDNCTVFYRTVANVHNKIKDNKKSIRSGIYMKMKSSAILMLLLLNLFPMNLIAKNIDLSTLPSRDSVQLTIYNSEDLTLVRETRKISIKKGQNRLQFSWANTRIDPTSVQIEFLSQTEAIQLTNTLFPHEKPQMLYWNLKSSVETLATVEISYFTSGISWQADYSGILNQSGNTMALDSFVTVSNLSGEDYDNAEVRLVIGKINLVEKVNELVEKANRSKNEVYKKKKSRRQKVARAMMSKEAGAYQAVVSDYLVMGDVEEEKVIEKDSLSEYTIFSIEGTETIPNLWSKRLRSGFSEAITLETVYRYRPREYGEILARILIFKNNKESALGEAPLAAGKIQIYQKNREGSLTYIAGLPLKYTSVGEKIELNTGADPEIIFNLVNLKVWRDNIWMHYRKGNVYRRIEDGHIKVDHNSTVSGWDEHNVFVQHLRNFTGKPVKVELRRVIYGDALIKSQLNIKKYDFQTVEFNTVLKVGEKKELLYETLLKKGRNAKQNRVSLKNQVVHYPVF